MRYGTGLAVASLCAAGMAFAAPIEGPVKVAPGETKVIDGRGKAWSALVGKKPVEFLAGETAIARFGADLQMDDFTLTCSSGAKDKPGTWLDIEAARFGFKPPQGGIGFFGSFGKKGDPAGSATIRVKNAAVSVPHHIAFAGFCQPTNRLVLSHCRGVFGYGARSDAWSGSGDSKDNGRPGLQEYCVTDGSCLTNSYRFFAGYRIVEKGVERFSSRNKTFRVKVEKGSSLAQYAVSMTEAGHHELVVTGKGSSFVSYAAMTYLGHAAEATGLVEVTDGASFAVLDGLTLGSTKPEHLASSRGDFRADNATVSVRHGLSLARGDMSLANGTSATFDSVRMGCVPAEGRVGTFSIDGSTVAFTGPLVVSNATFAARKAKVLFGGVARLGRTTATATDSVLTIGPWGKLCGGASGLSVDGVTIEVKPQPPERERKGLLSPLEGFGTMTVGAKGLTVACDKKLVLETSFVGTGTLTLTGSGKKRITGDVRVKKLVVTGGDVEIDGTCTAEVSVTGKTLVTAGGTLLSLRGWRNEKVLKRFADRRRYEIVEIDEGRGFDLGRTAKRPDTTFFFPRTTNTICTAVVPCEEYVRAWVLCSVDPDAKKDRHFTVRLTRYANAKKHEYRGRSRRGMADSHVNFDTAKKELVGEVRSSTTNHQPLTTNHQLWLVEVPLETGDIQDVLYVDNHGSYNELAEELRRRELGRYLDLELLGRTKTHPVSALHTITQNANPDKVSAVTVYDVALERPPCEMRMLWTEPGNIFHNDEKPETKVALTVHRPGRHELSWVVRNPEDEIVSTGRLPVTASGTNVISLAQKELGWYRLDWTLKDGEKTMLTHAASFALLGPDTRTTGCGEPPYGCGGAGGDSHYRIPDKLYDIQGPLFLKAGFRRCFWSDMPREKAYQWKVAPAICARFPEYWREYLKEKKPTDAEIKARIEKNLKDFPMVKTCMIFHESANKPYQQAEEIFGGTHDPKNDLADADLHYRQALRASTFMRENFPDVKITIGNTLACSELVAELMRRGLPKENVDYIGLGPVVMANLPERMTCSALQGADLMRELCKVYGYPWKPNAIFEVDYRRHSSIGYDRQAMWYVRDLLLQQCWRFPDIYVSDLVTVGNHYAESFWGDAGVCERWPMLYPFKGYVGLATATKVLDRVTDRRHIPTGDGGPFLVEFSRADGKVVYAYWMVYGEADLELTTSGKFEITDFFGRTRQPQAVSKLNFVPGKEKRFLVKATEWPNWIVADAPIVKGAKTLVCRHPGQEKTADTFRKITDTSDFDAWTVSNVFPKAGIARKLGSFPSRVPGKGAAKAVDDPEKGRVIELELVEPDLSLPANVDEYTTLVLKNPIKIEGKPLELGVWVKGNAGWGSVYFIVKDRQGSIWTSCGHPGVGDMDEMGKKCISFGGWRYLTLDLTRHDGYSPWTQWTLGTFEQYPATLIGIGFAAQSRPLFLDERKPRRQFIRIGSFGARGDKDKAEK